MNGFWGSEKKRIAIVLAFAFLLRIAALIVWNDSLSKDTDAYWGIAERIASEEGYSHPDTGKPTAYRPPLYPLVIAATIKLGGGPTALGMLQVLLGTATVWLVWKIGLRFGLENGAIIAATLIAIDPLLVRYTSHVMTETLCGFLAALLLLAISSDRRRHPFLRSFSSSIIFGLAAICRPTFWAFGGLMVLAWLWTWWKARRSTIDEESETMSRKRSELIAVALGLLLTVFPWFLRNCLVMDAPIPMTTHGGYTILLGNNPTFYEEVVAKPLGTVWSDSSRVEWSKKLADDLLEDGVSFYDEVPTDRWMTAKAVQHIRENPAMFFRACLLRFVRFWNVIPLKSNFPFVLKAGMAFFYCALFLAMLVGLFHMLRRWDDDWIPMLMLIASFTLVHLVYWSNTRMRAPVMPAVAVLAAVGISVLRNRWQKESDQLVSHRSLK